MGVAADRCKFLNIQSVGDYDYVPDGGNQASLD